MSFWSIRPERLSQSQLSKQFFWKQILAIFGHGSLYRAYYVKIAFLVCCQLVCVLFWCSRCCHWHNHSKSCEVSKTLALSVCCSILPFHHSSWTDNLSFHSTATMNDGIWNTLCNVTMLMRLHLFNHNAYIVPSWKFPLIAVILLLILWSPDPFLNWNPRSFPALYYTIYGDQENSVNIWFAIQALI